MFVTFRLYGSIPAGRAFPPERLTGGRAFVAMDRLLDHAVNGPMYLRHPEIAEMMVQAIVDGEGRFQRYELHAFVVMANHVHMLVTPHVDARRWLGPLKGFTAHEGNRIMGCSGGTFWQPESYDHLVRTAAEFGNIKRYVENNPVKAGLVASPAEFPWSSAAPGRSPAAA